MAGRPPKKHIDYAGWATNIFDNDQKIDKLLDAQGWIGFGVYFFLCQRAYGSEGYFYRWGYDDCATTARKMGGGIGSGTVRETVGYCLQIGLFDKGLFDRWGILTSRGIQRRYWAVISDKDVKKVTAEYWLLQKEECKGLLIAPLNNDLSVDNSNFTAGNSNFEIGNADFAPLKKRKEKESKENKNIKDTDVSKKFMPPSVDEVKAYCNERNNGINAEQFVNFYESKGWMVGKNKMKNWKAAVGTWEQKRKADGKGINNEPEPTKYHIPDGNEVVRGIFQEYKDKGLSIPEIDGPFNG